ncbi:hypothetical protein ACFL2V_09635 [Pseudomonadota bacterium]
MGAGSFRALALFISFILVGSPSLAMSSSAKPKVYAYTLLTSTKTGDTQPMARVVIDNALASCPELVGKHTKVLTTPRENPSATHFPVTVCEAFIPYGEKFKVNIKNSVTLAAVTQSPAKVLVYGDTGCKAKDCPKTFS